MNKLFVLLYMDIAVSDFKIFSSYEDALKEYLSVSISNTKKLLSEVVDETGSDASEVSSNKEVLDSDLSESCEDAEDDPDYETEADDLDMVTCTLQVFELQGTEFRPCKDFDEDYFQDFLDNKDDVSAYLDGLEADINEGRIPDDIREAFSP